MKLTNVFIYLFICVIGGLSACSTAHSERERAVGETMNNDAETALQIQAWGEVQGKPVQLYHLENANGMRLVLSNYGAAIIKVIVPDRDGKFADVALGYATLADYEREMQTMGMVVGRYHNRIRNGRFELNGKQYEISKNEGPNTIHGGKEFQQVVWDAEPIHTDAGPGLRLSYFSPDGSHGFPGNVSTRVTYVLTDANEIDIHFEANADQQTPLNFTQHAYFNLNAVSDTVLDHVVSIDADTHAAFDMNALQTGRVESLRGQAFDLIKPTRIGENVSKIALGGYHQTYILNKKPGEFKQVATVYEPGSGRTMTVSTSSPSLTFYVAMGLNNSIPGKYGIEYGPYKGLCLEAGFVPDSVNYAQFPSTIFGPQRAYDERVLYKFGVRN